MNLTKYVIALAVQLNVRCVVHSSSQRIIRSATRGLGSSSVHYQVVFLRHGESTFNAENRFIGWTDVPLTAKGEEEARLAAAVLSDVGFRFDGAICSYLKRAIKTCWVVLDAIDQSFIPQENRWELNERFFGDLVGKNSVEANSKYGADMVEQLQKSYRERPPPMPMDNPLHPINGTKYKIIGNNVPSAECMADVESRVSKYWTETVSQRLKDGQVLLICSHAVCLKALFKVINQQLHYKNVCVNGSMKFIDNVPEEVAISERIPRAVPIVFEFDKDMKPLKSPGSKLPWSGIFLENDKLSW